jgi:hypothetical protein
MRRYKFLNNIPISILKEVVRNKTSFRSVRMELTINYNIRKNKDKILKNILNENNIDYSHFTGQVWNKGLHFNVKRRKKKFLKKTLINGKQKQSFLKKGLLEFNLLENKCYTCGLQPIWNNKKLIMHLEHKNGNKNDNRLENLTLLCPNCHSQTETYCRCQGKYVGKTKHQILKEELFNERLEKLKLISFKDSNWVFKLGKLWGTKLRTTKWYLKKYFPKIYKRTLRIKRFILRY